MVRVVPWSLLIVAIVPLGGASFALADAPSLLDEQLATGEFGPAVRTARQLPAGAGRDAALARIAESQASAGAYRSAASTLAEVDDDRQRSERYDALATRREGRAGGGVQPDFDSLIELITSTIAPQSWTDVGGQGAVKPFPGGVYVDARGLMARSLTSADSILADVADASRPDGSRASSDVRRAATLRKISLPKLERAVEQRLAAGLPLDEAMQYLAGIQRIRYVMIYPETGDLVLAGPAGDWQTDREGRVVSVGQGQPGGQGQPVVRLEDLVVLLRHLRQSADGRFGCSITPTQEALARTKAFVEQSAAKPLKPGQRDAWLGKLRDQLGAQTIEVQGIDPHCRVAQVMVEADYRMKLVGIGLEEGVLGVTSYLDMLKTARETPALNVLRWWFTLNYRGIAASAARDAFELRGQGVKVLSENELLNELGERVHTGAADTLTSEFAQQFTQHFPELSARYPVYAELRNVFDLALVAAVIRGQQLDEKVGWHMLCFGSPERFPVRRGPVPERVETVINHRVVDRTKILAVVSGGVSVEPAALARPEAFAPDPRGQLEYQRTSAQTRSAERSTWWWD